MALSNWIARSVSCASTAVLTRVISRLAVSLRETTHSAQMRSSIALAVVSSGASLSAPNRKSIFWVRSPRATLGSFFGGSAQLCAGRKGVGRDKGSCKQACEESRAHDEETNRSAGERNAAMEVGGSGR